MEKPRAHKQARDRRDPCPECDRSFTPRGMAGHRRLAHGVRVSGESSTVVGRTMDRVDSTLELICRMLERLDDRMDRLERRSLSEAELSALSGELEQVLAEIADVQAEYCADPDGSEDREDRRDRCNQELGRLRRRQVELLHHLGQNAPGNGDAGFDLWKVL